MLQKLGLEKGHFIWAIIPVLIVSSITIFLEGTAGMALIVIYPATVILTLLAAGLSKGLAYVGKILLIWVILSGAVALIGTLLSPLELLPSRF